MRAKSGMPEVCSRQGQDSSVKMIVETPRSTIGPVLGAKKFNVTTGAAGDQHDDQTNRGAPVDSGTDWSF